MMVSALLLFLAASSLRHHKPRPVKNAMLVEEATLKNEEKSCSMVILSLQLLLKRRVILP
jgi:hypothetical protein